MRRATSVIRAEHDEPLRDTHCPRGYVCNMVSRYAVGYVCSNRSQPRVHHARCQVSGGRCGCVRHYASPQVTGYVSRHLPQPLGG